MKYTTIINELKTLFPEAKCELNYSSDWQLLIAIILSAQCSDKSVNKVTPILFCKYPSIKDLKDAKFEDVEQILHPLGLSNVKATKIISLANNLYTRYNSRVPQSKEELVELPGVGVKSANVMLIEYFNTPAFPVDTHVSRVSKRLNISNKTDTVNQIEKKLMTVFPKKEWANLHKRMVLFGRYICTAKNPKCNECPFLKLCILKK